MEEAAVEGVAGAHDLRKGRGRREGLGQVAEVHAVAITFFYN